MLYQRYFIRMNQSNMTHLLGLLLAMCVVLGILQLILTITTHERVRIRTNLTDSNFTDPENLEKITTTPGTVDPAEFSQVEETKTAASTAATTTTEIKPPPPIRRNYYAPDERQKSSISLLERIRNPNARKTNYLNLTAKKVEDEYDEEEEQEITEYTHFRERIQMSNKDFRYKTSRNKTNKSGRQKRKVNFSDIAATDFPDEEVLQNNFTSRTPEKKMADNYHIGAGLTLLSCILVYSGEALRCQACAHVCRY